MGLRHSIKGSRVNHAGWTRRRQDRVLVARGRCLGPLSGPRHVLGELIIFILIGLSFVPGSAQARVSGSGAEEPPKVGLINSAHGDDAIQDGRLLGFCWYGVSDGTCAQSAWAFPRRATIGLKSELEVVIHDTARPLETTLTMWRRVRDGSPSGKKTQLETTLVPRVIANEVVWVLRFERAELSSRSYLALDGEWLNGNGCVDCPNQLATWTFFLKVPNAD